MTTGTNDTQPQPSPEPTPADAGAAQPQSQSPAGNEPEPVVDIDAQDVLDAQAAAQAEEAAGEGTENPDPSAGATQGQPSKAPQHQDQASGAKASDETPTIPKPRFDEALAKQREAETAAAYWRGVAEARGQSPGQPAKPDGGTGQTSPQQPTADARLAEIGAQQDALAAQYDNGEITYADLKKQERQLANQEQAIREEVLLAKTRPANAKPDATSDELYLGTLTAQLETEHPWVSVFDSVGSEAEWNFFKQQAIDNLTKQGVDPTQGAMGRYQLRKEISELMDRYGPTMVAERAKAQGIALPGQQTPSQGGNQQTQQQGKPALSPAALARQGKLHLAAGAPPNVKAMSGTADDGTGVPTEASLEAMGEEAIGNLPDATRKRLLGIT